MKSSYRDILNYVSAVSFHHYLNHYQCVLCLLIFYLQFFFLIICCQILALIYQLFCCTILVLMKGIDARGLKICKTV